LDVIQGEKALFIRDDELKVAWDIFSPALAELEATAASRKPVTYGYGSSGPIEADYQASHFGVEWSE
jgi:glucose-6-phosphate 1-dehydrogenase